MGVRLPDLAPVCPPQLPPPVLQHRGVDVRSSSPLLTSASLYLRQSLSPGMARVTRARRKCAWIEIGGQRAHIVQHSTARGSVVQIMIIIPGPLSPQMARGRVESTPKSLTSMASTPSSPLQIAPATSCTLALSAAASRDPVNPAAPQEMERGAYEERRPADPLAPPDHVPSGGSDTVIRPGKWDRGRPAIYNVLPGGPSGIRTRGFRLRGPDMHYERREVSRPARFPRSGI